MVETNHAIDGTVPSTPSLSLSLTNIPSDLLSKRKPWPNYHPQHHCGDKPTQYGTTEGKKHE